MLSLLTFALLPGIIRIGHTRLSVFGLLAAIGLIAAITLSQRTATLANLSAQQLWDAGIFTVAAALVLSRLLLIAEDPHAFLRYPLIVLSLPSLTYAGIGLTLAATLIYLRLKQMPILATLDAWTPCAAIFGGALSLAHFVEGTDAGMPTSLPWGVLTPGDTVLGRVHPVQLYLLLAAIYLFFDTLRLLRRPHRAGVVAAHGLYLGGASFFLLDMLAQPADVHSAYALDPGQYIALGCFVIGSILRFIPMSSSHVSRSEFADILENLRHNRAAAYDHERIAYGRFDDPLLKRTQERFNDVYGHSTTEAEWSELMEYVQQIRGHQPSAERSI